MEVIVVGMIFSLLLLGMVGSFVLLYPVARRFGAYLERRIENGGSGTRLSRSDLSAIHGAIRDLQSRVEDLSERQDFTERLLEGREPPGLGPSHRRHEER